MINAQPVKHLSKCRTSSKTLGQSDRFDYRLKSNNHGMSTMHSLYDVRRGQSLVIKVNKVTLAKL